MSEIEEKQKLRSGKKGSKSLIESYPEVARQLHSTLNEGLTADLVTAHSNKSLVWQCDVKPDHVWTAKVNNRTSRHSGCPFCAHKRVDDVSSLVTLYPEVAKEWHRERNGSLRPEDVSEGSSRLVWWRCQSDPKHEWQSRIVERTHRHNSCPFCSGRLVTDENRLSTQFPDIASELHPELNRMLYPASEHNRSWYPKNRIGAGELPRRNRKIQASDIVYTSKEAFWWQCRKSDTHVWKAGVCDRADGHGCPFCAGKKAAPDNSLEGQYPGVAKLFHPSRNAPITPGQITPGSGKKFWWRCFKSADHVFPAVVSSVVRSWENGNNACPYCAGKMVSIKDSLARKYPSVAKLFHPTRNKPLEPTQVLPFSNRLVWFRCPKRADHLWQAKIAWVVRSFKNGQSGCPYCAGRKVAKADSLANKFPDIAKLWDKRRNQSLKASEVLPGSHKEARFCCPRSVHHVWPQVIRDLVKTFEQGKNLCPFCRDAEVKSD